MCTRIQECPGSARERAWALNLPELGRYFICDSPEDAKGDNAAKDWAYKFNNRLSMRRPDYVVDVGGPTAALMPS